MKFGNAGPFFIKHIELSNVDSINTGFCLNLQTIGYKPILNDIYGKIENSTAVQI